MADNIDLAQMADATLDQYFLSAPDKLSLLSRAAGIRSGDRVVEIGAGAGTVARIVPSDADLTLIELDSRLVGILRSRFPHAEVIEGDALGILSELPCDVLLSNLPNRVTETLIPILQGFPFRTAVLAVGENSNLTRLSANLTYEIISEIGGNDFVPPQPTVSKLVKVTRA